jgi:hypothetical protein
MVIPAYGSVVGERLKVGEAAGMGVFIAVGEDNPVTVTHGEAGVLSGSARGRFSLNEETGCAGLQAASPNNKRITHTKDFVLI